MERKGSGSWRMLVLASIASCSLSALAGEGKRRVDYVCPGGETFSAVFAADGKSVLLIVGETSRKLEAAADGKYFTADAVFFGDDPDTGAFVAEGETVVLQDCRPS